jgi:cation diffusion facilitator family transporter
MSAHDHPLPDLANDHATGVGLERHERRTRLVVVISAGMMVAELIVGRITGSMALTADGWHMATHVAALLLSALAYWFARSRARHAAYSFGTGKVHALAGYTGAVGLGLAALFVAGESVLRLIEPQPVRFQEALLVAALGLAVNLVCAWILKDDEHEHGREHDHVHQHGAEHAHAHDQNLRSAYLHVLADALTSVLAILALLAGQYLGWSALDSVAGLVGAVMIVRWSLELGRGAARQLLDVRSSAEQEQRVRTALEAIDDVHVLDLHVWAIGPGRLGCVVALVTSIPREADEYRRAVRSAVDLAHLTVEVHRCREGHEEAA